MEPEMLFGSATGCLALPSPLSVCSSVPCLAMPWQPLWDAVCWPPCFHSLSSPVFLFFWTLITGCTTHLFSIFFLVNHKNKSYQNSSTSLSSLLCFRSLKLSLAHNRCLPNKRATLMGSGYNKNVQGIWAQVEVPCKINARISILCNPQCTQSKTFSLEWSLLWKCIIKFSAGMNGVTFIKQCGLDTWRERRKT